LSLARLRQLAPGLRTVGLSATVARPSELRAYLVPQNAPQSHIEMADLVLIGGGAKPQIDILELDETMPTVGHTTRYAIGEIYAAIEARRLCLLFVNTRMQAELLFQDLWRINDLGLPIGLHHGSLDALQRRKVEAAMAAGSLRAVVATSTLDLGIDWGDVDLVIHVGAPKGASRFIQRIGRSNHRLDEPSQAILVPSNRFEVLECRAAVDAAEAGEQDVTFTRRGALDVLAQHILGTACAGDFDPGALYTETVSAAPYASLMRETFDRVLGFVTDGGYALKGYERYAKLKPAPDGKLRIAHPRFMQAYRMNAGTIVAAPMIKVRLVGRRATAARKAMTGGRVMGEVDEYFIEQLRPGDAFVLAGEVLRFEGMSENEAFVTRATARDPVIPSYNSGKFPLSTHLAGRVRAMLADDHAWSRLPPSVAYWLELQRERSVIPGRDEVLIETFARGNCHYLVAYPFEGRLAHQTLGMLLTRRLDRIGAGPLGFVANDYGMALWCIGDLSALIAAGKLDLDELFSQD
ncbi:MAG: helicase-related protein, partial [Hyphomicrobium sp.]|nr:helicase-related protein [Hyphomicrobium sp.]